MSAWHNCYATSNSFQLPPCPLELCDLHPRICGQSNSGRRGKRKIWNTYGCSTFLFRQAYQVWVSRSLTSPFFSKCSVRLPKWLGNRPRLTNIPFLAASDLGSVCSSSSGEAGVCTQERECRGPDREKLGVCTLFKSACCKGKRYIKCGIQIWMFCRKGFVPFRKYIEVFRIQESFFSGAWGWYFHCPCQSSWLI